MIDEQSCPVYAVSALWLGLASIAFAIVAIVAFVTFFELVWAAQRRARAAGRKPPFPFLEP